ncbi:MAG: hydantoinase B/oxoprolinase family protein [Anaerolineae bacterium]
MIDPISLEVFRNLFASAAEDMGITLQRAAFSPNIRERLDFSCALFDAAGRLVAQAAHIPVHLGSMPAAVQHALKVFGELNEGDVVLLNDPYRGGTHLPDITAISGVYLDGAAQFYLASRAHHADVGGMSPGSLPLSTELYQEGLIIPPVKLIAGGVRNNDLFSLILANSRAPEERHGDLEAQFAAHRVGEQRLRSLLQTHGSDHVQAHAAALIDYSRRLTEAVIVTIPDGTYTFEDALESDGQSETPLPIRVAITISGSRMTVDFAGTASQTAGNLNAVEAIVRSATGYCVRLLATEDIPVNHGCFEPITILTPAGSLLNPQFPAAVVIGNTETGQRVTDVVLGALSKALPDKIPAASQGTMNNITFGGIVDGTAFVYYETIGGGHGASPQGDGLSGRHTHMTNTRNGPVEALEYALPIRVREYQLRSNSGGSGLHHGGEGVRRIYEFLAPAQVTLNTERRIRQPYGLQGGDSGQCGVNKLIRDGVETILGGKSTLRVQSGDQIVIETPGGGGWGH